MQQVHHLCTDTAMHLGARGGTGCGKGETGLGTTGVRKALHMVAEEEAWEAACSGCCLAPTKAPLNSGKGPFKAGGSPGQDLAFGKVTGACASARKTV